MLPLLPMSLVYLILSLAIGETFQLPFCVSLRSRLVFYSTPAHLLVCTVLFSSCVYVRGLSVSTEPCLYVPLLMVRRFCFPLCACMVCDVIVPPAHLSLPAARTPSSG